MTKQPEDGYFTIAMAFLFFLALALTFGYRAALQDAREALAACKAERPTPPPPKCRFTEGDVKEAIAGWENAVDIATTCVIDLDLCRQNLENRSPR